MRVIEVSHGQPEAVLPTLSSAPARYGNLPARPSARPAGPRTRYLAHQYAAHLGRPPLRTADGHSHDLRRASWLELFFDLAFAGAVGQLAGALQSHLALGTLARFAMLFVPIWWLWVQLTFYADRHESEDGTHRVSFLVAILLCIGLAASAPRALYGNTAGFVIAFACLRGLQLLLYARARHHLPRPPRPRPPARCAVLLGDHAALPARGDAMAGRPGVGGPAVRLARSCLEPVVVRRRSG